VTVDKNNARIRKLHYDVDHFFFYGYFFWKNTKEWLMEIADMIIDNLTPS